MAQWLKAILALLENPGSILISYMLLTMICNYSTREFNDLFWLLKEPSMCEVYRYLCKHTHKSKFKVHYIFLRNAIKTLSL